MLEVRKKSQGEWITLLHKTRCAEQRKPIWITSKEICYWSSFRGLWRDTRREAIREEREWHNQKWFHPPILHVYNQEMHLRWDQVVWSEILLTSRNWAQSEPVSWFSYLEPDRPASLSKRLLCEEKKKKCLKICMGKQRCLWIGFYNITERIW